MANRGLSRVIFLVIVLAGQAFFYGLRWSQSDVLTSDFPYFFIVGHLYAAGKNPYDLNSQCPAQAALGKAVCAGYSHAPILLPLYAVLFNDDIYTSFWRWTVVQIFLLAICVYLLYLIAYDLSGAVQCALFPPVMIGLLNGNDTIFMLAALLGWAVLLLNRKDVWAGLCLSLVVLKPQLALPLAIALLFVRPKAFIGFCIGGFILTLYSFMLVGMEGFHGIIDITRSLSKGSILGGVSHAYMFNTTGLFARAGINTVWVWPIYIASMIGVSLFLRRVGVTRFSISLAVIVTVFCCPHLFFYDLSFLTLPLINAHPLAPMVGSLMTAPYLVGFPWWTVYLMMAGLTHLIGVRNIKTGTNDKR